MKQILMLSIFIHGIYQLKAQHEEVSLPLEPAAHKDTANFLYALKNGKLQGHVRYFMMASENEGALSDHFANALGGGIKYETAPFKGFRLGVSGYFIFNIGSSALSKADPSTKQLSRYELGLFDVEDPSNKSDMDRLEELYIKYSWKHSYFTFGKQLINTPFLNLQDGRMRPTQAGGLYGEINELKNTGIELGYLYELSPRGTVKWYKVEESIGLFPQGINPDGTLSDYANNLESKGIALLGVKRKLGEHFSIKVNNAFVHNILNSVLMQADYTYSLEKESKIFGGLQMIRQNALNRGGNPNQAKTYFPQGGHSQTFGARVVWVGRHWETSINYNRITAKGRYLMPREWGNDPFFTFMPRERNEGFGDVHALVIRNAYNMDKKGVKISLDAGYFRLPDVKEIHLNKYGMPSYYQLNAALRYKPVFAKGLDLHLLYVYKGRMGNTYQNPQFVFNKVNLSLYNLVINYVW